MISSITMSRHEPSYPWNSFYRSNSSTSPQFSLSIILSYHKLTCKCLAICSSLLAQPPTSPTVINPCFLSLYPLPTTSQQKLSNSPRIAWRRCTLSRLGQGNRFGTDNRTPIYRCEGRLVRRRRGKGHSRLVFCG